jgi:hypothetical protein
LSSTGIWQKFVSNSDYQPKRSVLFPAEILWAEATKCYDASANLACCICARGAIEAALHQAKTRTAAGSGGSVAFLEDTGWGELRTWAKGNGLIDPTFEKRIDNARDMGNLGAHLGQKIDQAYMSGGTPKLDVTPREAYNALETCAEMIGRIAKQRWP